MMKKIVSALLVFSLFVGVGSLFAQQATVNHGASLRGDPSTKNPPIGHLIRNEGVILLSTSPQAGFYHIKNVDGTEGWVAMKYLNVESAGTPTTPTTRRATPASTTAKRKTTTGAHVCVPENTAPGTDQPGCGTHCGTERWRVKTVTDDDANAVSTTWETKTVSDLVSQTAPRSVPETSRIPIEKTQVAVEALLIGRKIETDGDFLLVIADPSDQSLTMIAEIPSATCTSACQSSFVQDFKTARAAVVNELGQPTRSFVRLRTPEKVNIIGIPFFDFDHGQTGLAKNCIEIHPVLSISFSASSPTQKGGTGNKKGGSQAAATPTPK